MKKPAKPPKGLGYEARALWRAITSTWIIDEQAAAVLGEACRALDRVNEARKILKAEGLVVTTPATGARHEHPAVKIETAARAQFLGAWKLLAFSEVTPAEAERIYGEVRTW